MLFGWIMDMLCWCSENVVYHVAGYMFVHTVILYTGTVSLVCSVDGYTICYVCYVDGYAIFYVCYVYGYDICCVCYVDGYALCCVCNVDG